jgi:4-hydroxy-tetrahydrodipicolinate synthase
MPKPIAGLRGVVPPAVTPLTADGTFDQPSYRRVLAHLLAGGVHGIFALGSTSECVFFGEAERRRIVDATVESVNGRVPVLVGVMDPATDRVIAHAKAAEAAGCDGIVMTAPFYTLTDQTEIIDHFKRVRDAIGIPLVAYDIPVCVHVKLQRRTVRSLVEGGIVIGLKDSSGDDGNLRYCLTDNRDRPDAFFMTGGELTVDGGLLMGLHGAVPGLGNVDPAGYVRLYDAALRGDWAAARAEQDRLCRLFEIVRVGAGRVSPGAAGVGGFKTAMRALGIIATNVMASPRAALDDAESARVAAILASVGLPA